ncbi:MAG TPA: four helix bundle protein [Bacteroidales bacterium]|nr:four helix bundle protein [Bacteroidales bacterium]HRZ48260.1 four helix bundle protein [Bacteroidales bacterium]
MIGKNDLSERLLGFAIKVILFLRKLPNNDENIILKKQLIRSATSSGANYEESQGGSSRADFTNKVRISLKEMREAYYWLKIFNGIIINEEMQKDCGVLIKESQELKNILGAICTKTERKA